MKCLVIDGIIFGLQKAGGISRTWAEAIIGLDQSFALKNKVYLLVPRNSNVEWERIQKRLYNIKICKRKRFRWGKQGFLRESAYLSFLAMKFKPDIWHSSYYVGMPLWGVKRSISMFYDMIPEVLNIASEYETRMKYKTLQKSQKIISISNHSLKDLTKFWPEFTHKSHVIHLCGSEKNELEERDDWVSFPYFLFVGKRGGYKNFINFLKVFLEDSSFQKYHIIAAGGETSWNKDELEIIKTFNAEERMHCEGILPYEEIQKLIALSSCVLYPSIYEGFGLPILEAFDHGVPVLACSSSSIPEITGQQYPLADPHQPETFVTTLRKLMEEKPYWVDYAKNRTVHFKKEKMIQAWLDLYQHEQ